MRDYIEQHCGIRVGDDKMYLVETRLTTLMVEQGCSDFRQLQQKARADTTHRLRDKIVDAMTTNETLWFRDGWPFEALRTVLLPRIAKELQTGRRRNVRIWSAACSTGQEPYSIAMAVKDVSRTAPTLRSGAMEISATDISQSALFLAMSGRYDQFAMGRGLPEQYKSRYFARHGRVWELRDEIKSMVSFKKLNLQESFEALGTQDIIFCRNVLIYFSDQFKRDILSRIRRMLNPGGALFVGASESMLNYSSEYRMVRNGKAVWYEV
jgi:chemotaxis protein methyltransferase CheR